MEYKQKKLSELVNGEAFEGFLLVKSAAVRTGSTGKNYLDLSLADDKTAINAKAWDYYDALSRIAANDLVKVRATVTVWQNVLQLRIEKIRLATKEDPAKIEDFVPSAPQSGEEMLSQVLSYAAKIKDGDLSAIVGCILERYHEKLLYWPAAMSNHHAVRSGLLYHTLTMLRAGEALCSVYTNLDTDWVYAGVIVHDIEKIEELGSNELGLVSDYTRDGLLLGHIIQCTVLIGEVGKELGADPEKVALLQHMVTAHHYEPEYGSPRRPMFPEAELLHYLDIIDARMYDFTRALADVQEGGFTEKQWLLQNRRLYKKHTGAKMAEENKENS